MDPEQTPSEELAALQDMLRDAEITTPRREVNLALETIRRLENEGRVRLPRDYRGGEDGEAE